MVPSGCRLFWLSTVTILLLGVAEAWMNCAWTGRVTTTGRPYSEYSSSYSNTDGASPVNDIIKDLQVFHLMPSDTQVISAYGYYVLAKIECDDQDPSQIARSLHMQGGTVVVTATVPSQGVRGNHLTRKELSFEGALVELNSSCPSSSVCDPAWVVPLPVSEDHHLLYLDVSTRGGTHAIQRLRFTVHSDGYWRDYSEESPLCGIGSEVSEQDFQQLLSSLESSPVNFLPSVASPSFFALTGRFAVFSNDLLMENVFVEISRVSVTKVCEGTKPFAITLADRLLYGDDQAVFEMFGRFASVMSHTGGFQPIEMDSCIHRIVIPPHSHLVEWSVYAIAGEESDEIYQAALINGQPLSFSMVLDTADAGPCHFVMSALQDVTSCNVRSGTPSATSSYEAVFLIETITAGEVLYCVLSLTGTFEEREWELLTTIPATNCTDIDSDSCLIGPDLILTDITAVARPSKHLFVWGNVLIHSPDGGVTWYHITEYTSPANITILTTSSDGQLAILNEDREIWYGFCGVTVSLVMLRPSDGWMLNGIIDQSEESRNGTLSLFFDNSNSLREVYTSINESGYSSISSRVIPASRIVQVTQHYGSIGLSGTLNLDQHLCPIRRFHLVVEQSHSSERREYYEFSPPLLTNSVVHDGDSLSVYQGLLHLVMDLREQTGYTYYTGDLYNPMEQWLASHQPLESYHDYLYRNRLLEQGLGVYVPLKPFINQGIEVKNGTIFTLPSEVFLDKRGIYSFIVQLRGWPLLGEEGFDGFHGLEHLLLSAEVSHLDLLQVNLDRHVDYLRDTVEYLVTLTDLSSAGYQAPPGQLLLTSSVTIETWGSAMKCFLQEDDRPTAQGLLTMNVIHGCPPGRVLQYDINSTILFNGIDTVYDCPEVDPLLPCVYFNHEFHPQFEILDLTTGNTDPFTGPYTLRVIGGHGPEESGMEYYTSEEIEKYNSDNRHSTVWAAVDAESDEDNVVAFDRDHSGLLWRCMQYSPCGDRPLNFPYAPEYTFLVEVTNKDVRSADTYCDYTVQFRVRIHGLPISSKKSVRIVVWCLVLSFVIIGLFLLCDWNDRRIWKRFKGRVRRGFRVHPRAGSTEWNIQSSTSSKSDSSGSASYGGTLSTRRRYDRGAGRRNSGGEVTWNQGELWEQAPTLDTALEEVSEGEERISDDGTAEPIEGVRSEVGMTDQGKDHSNSSDTDKAPELTENLGREEETGNINDMEKDSTSIAEAKEQ